MSVRSRYFTRLMNYSALAILIGAVPLECNFSKAIKFSPFSISVAFADSGGGSGGSGSGGSGSGGSGSGGSGSGGSGSSGSGSGGGGSGNSGSGNSGSGNSGSGGSNSGSGSANSGSDSNNSGTGNNNSNVGNSKNNYANGGRKNYGHDHHSHDGRSPLDLKKFFKILRGHGSIAKAERNSKKIEVTYEDGWKEEIENEIYRLKTPANLTISRRRVRQTDIDRLNSAF